MVYFTKRGSILIALLFVIILSLTAVSFFFSIGGRTTLVANHLKREQAINCAEAALYEAFNRMRADPRLTPWGSNPWPAAGTDIIIPVGMSDGTTYTVTVKVKRTTSAQPYNFEAEVDYGDIRM